MCFRRVPLEEPQVLFEQATKFCLLGTALQEWFKRRAEEPLRRIPLVSELETRICFFVSKMVFFCSSWNKLVETHRPEEPFFLLKKEDAVSFASIQKEEEQLTTLFVVISLLYSLRVVTCYWLVSSCIESSSLIFTVKCGFFGTQNQISVVQEREEKKRCFRGASCSSSKEASVSERQPFSRKKKEEAVLQRKKRQPICSAVHRCCSLLGTTTKEEPLLSGSPLKHTFITTIWFFNVEDIYSWLYSWNTPVEKSGSSGTNHSFWNTPVSSLNGSIFLNGTIEFFGTFLWTAPNGFSLNSWNERHISLNGTKRLFLFLLL